MRRRRSWNRTNLWWLLG